MTVSLREVVQRMGIEMVNTSEPSQLLRHQRQIVEFVDKVAAAIQRLSQSVQELGRNDSDTGINAEPTIDEIMAKEKQQSDGIQQRFLMKEQKPEIPGLEKAKHPFTTDGSSTSFSPTSIEALKTLRTPQPGGEPARQDFRTLISTYFNQMVDRSMVDLSATKGSPSSSFARPIVESGVQSIQQPVQLTTEQVNNITIELSDVTKIADELELHLQPVLKELGKVFLQKVRREMDSFNFRARANQVN